VRLALSVEFLSAAAGDPGDYNPSKYFQKRMTKGGSSAPPAVAQSSSEREERERERERENFINQNKYTIPVS